jgi:hypothetical protein
MLRAIRVLLVLGTASCIGNNDPTFTPIPVDQVPPGIRTIASDTLVGVQFQHAVIKSGDKYELQGVDAKGTRREIEITRFGTVVEIE